MKSGALFSLLVMSVLITGCNDEDTKSIDWYKSHEQERQAKTVLCKKASEPRTTEDCRNAIDAEHDKTPNNSTLDNAGQ
ncbi:hypothetical protein PRCB_17835 [Pantoea rodasii]|uniref:EexN family lipoprotein n=1 Tax=Pantoea rodasii TaxID=1076549 RepID=A0A2M9W9B8_9GAMM|nr:EexN family lipoprotein [Pantoea rodasii]ORM60944.1 hypothetical protein HA45_21350 [Pantoea rodasii]PJZ04134.1 hypothetical protein PRCB_17835 [Pantoea rodasii]